MENKNENKYTIPPKIQLKHNDIAAKEEAYPVFRSFTNSVNSDKLKSTVQDFFK